MKEEKKEEILLLFLIRFISRNRFSALFFNKGSLAATKDVKGIKHRVCSFNSRFSPCMIPCFVSRTLPTLGCSNTALGRALKGKLSQREIILSIAIERWVPAPSDERKSSWCSFHLGSLEFIVHHSAVDHPSVFDFSLSLFGRTFQTYFSCF